MCDQCEQGDRDQRNPVELHGRLAEWSTGRFTHQPSSVSDKQQLQKHRAENRKVTAGASSRKHEELGGFKGSTHSHRRTIWEKIKNKSINFSTYDLKQKLFFVYPNFDAPKVEFIKPALTEINSKCS